MKISLTIAILLFPFYNVLAQVGVSSDFIRGDIAIQVDPLAQHIVGKVDYEFLCTMKVDSIYLDARKMNITGIQLNGRNRRYSYDGRHLVIRNKFRKNKKYELKISYDCHPDQAVYFLGWRDSIPGNEQVWTQGQGKYSSHWVPSFDDMREKVRFSLEIRFDTDYEVIANGTLEDIWEDDQFRSWKWEMNRPMSSYLLAFAIGKYNKNRQYSASGIPIDMYFYPNDSLRFEPTYRYSAQIFDLFEKETGIDYPWDSYKMVPVRDFLYAGMENTGATIFSDAYLTDSISFTDRNFITINAHELAHQWFGNLVTETDASNHWLHEGFANYYAWLAEKEFLGEDHYYWMLFDKVEYLSGLYRDGKGESLLDPKASSPTFYDKGGLALLTLRNYLGADSFREGIGNFLRAYAFRNATVADFLNVMETTKGIHLDSFRKHWLEGVDFPGEEIVAFLRESHSPIDQFIVMKKELISSSADNEAIIRKYWETNTSSEFRKKVVLIYGNSLSLDFLREAFNGNDLRVRQALAMIPGVVLPDLFAEYESLLGDKSYVTLENALYTLWIRRPDRREEYLNKTKGILGFPNKNIRQLWLLLAILTKDYGSVSEQEMYRKELFGYTAPIHPMGVRELAFGLIGEVFLYTKSNLRDLINACIHPSWQFRQYARSILDRQLSIREQRIKLESILGDLEGAEYEYLLKELEQQ